MSMQIKDCEFLMKYCGCICFFTDPLFLMKTATVAKKRRDECLERPTGVIQQLRGQNFAIFYPLPPHFVHVVIEWP